jgi:hypothetical protein
MLDSKWVNLHNEYIIWYALVYSIFENYSKSQKNHKPENSIVLDSKWVNLHNEYIIWYALVYIFFVVALDLCSSS